MLKSTALAVALLWPLSGHAGEQIPCWQVNAVLAWALGNEAKAEKLARKHGYSRVQIEEAKHRCKSIT
jgi:hypothetical protein